MQQGGFNSQKTSVNINECERLSSPCHHKANCTDTEGSYKCTCIDGYVGDGKDCKPGKSMYHCFLW